MSSKFHITWSDEIWHPMFHDQSFTISIEDLQQLVQQRKAHEDGLSRSLALLEAVPGSQIVAQQLRREIQAVQANAAALHAHLDRTWGLAPLLMRPASGVVADKVFKTPELLENILMYLPTEQKLGCMSVQRHWYHTVEGSVKLKRSLGLEPVIDNFFQSPFGYPGSDEWYELLDYHFPGGHLSSRSCSHDSLHDREDDCGIDNILIRGSFSGYSKKYSFGSRVGKMRIAHPPLLTLRASFNCEGEWNHAFSGDHSANDGTIILRAPSPDGFTVRSLHDALIKLVEEHPKICDWNRGNTHIDLQASLRLCEDDPIYVGRRERNAIRVAEIEKAKRARQEMWENELSHLDAFGWDDEIGVERQDDGDEALSDIDPGQVSSQQELNADEASSEENDGHVQGSVTPASHSLGSDHETFNTWPQHNEEGDWDSLREVDNTPW